MTLTYYGRLQVTAILMYIILAVGLIRTLIQKDNFYLEASSIAALVTFVMGNIYQQVLGRINGYFQPNWMVWAFALLELVINIIVALILQNRVINDQPAIDISLSKLIIHYAIAWVCAAGFATFLLQIFVRDIGDRSGEILGG